MYAPQWQAPGKGWATELLPGRPGAFAASLLGPHARPISTGEKQELGSAWQVSKPAPIARPPARNPILGGTDALNMKVDLSPPGESPKRRKHAGGQQIPLF